MHTDRRIQGKRASIVRRIVDEVIHKRAAVVTVEALRDLLDIPPEAAARIIDALVRAGLLAEIRAGVWMNVAGA